jgi:hypothetical protein
MNTINYSKIMNKRKLKGTYLSKVALCDASAGIELLYSVG